MNGTREGVSRSALANIRGLSIVAKVIGLVIHIALIAAVVGLVVGFLIARMFRSN